MKLLLFILFFTSTLLSQSLSWYGNYDNAHQEALRTHKPLLVLVVKKDDAKTREVLRDVFMKQPYMEALNERVVAVMATYEGNSSYPIELYYTTRFPALFLVDEREIFLTKPIYSEEITAKRVQALLELL